MKVIDKVSEKFHLSEGGQGKLQMKFAIYNKDTQEVITPFCMCKDYFSDAFWAKYTGNDVLNMYGFSFKKDDDQGLFDKDEISLAIRFVPINSKEFQDVNQENLDNILSFLNRFEKSNNFTLSVGEICEEGKSYIITFDRKWTQMLYLASAFFMFLRLGYYYDRTSEIKEYYSKSDKFITPNDQMYLKSTIEVVEDIEKGYLDKSQKYSDYTTQGQVHGSSGIVGYRSKYKKQETAQPATA